MRLKDVLKYELIGLHIEVTDAKTPSLKGIAGKIVEETRNTLTIATNNEEKTLVKEHITLTTTINGKTIEINGELLVGRPEERLKRKTKL